MALTSILLLPRGETTTGEEVGVLATTEPLSTQEWEDFRLTERINRALQATGYGALRALAVLVEARSVYLFGRVPSYFLKQIAQETALAVPGTYQLHNGLDVVSHK